MFLFGGEVNGTIIAAKKRRLAEVSKPRFQEVIRGP
jgi:hypothetical protein